MRLFVTGATGVVGRRAVPLLLSQGHSVTAGVRQTASRVSVVAQKDLDYVAVDLFDLAERRPTVAGHDAIINLATRMPSSAWNMMFRSSWRENDRIRTEGVANLVEAARRNGIYRFVQECFGLTYPDRDDVWIARCACLLHYFLRSSGLAVSRAHAMKSCANGLSVRFFRVMIAVG